MIMRNENAIAFDNKSMEGPLKQFERPFSRIRQIVYIKFDFIFHAKNNLAFELTDSSEKSNETFF